MTSLTLTYTACRVYKYTVKMVCPPHSIFYSDIKLIIDTELV